VFVAPTKPLVTQQVTACHDTCGIPAKDSIELTGEVPRSLRIRHVSCILFVELVRHQLRLVE
jgi:ATP-dependent DNA helicase MPH1